MSIYNDPNVQQALDDLQRANQKYLDALAVASGEECFDPWSAAYATASKRCNSLRKVNAEVVMDEQIKSRVTKQLVMNYMFPQK